VVEARESGELVCSASRCSCSFAGASCRQIKARRLPGPSPPGDAVDRPCCSLRARCCCNDEIGEVEVQEQQNWQLRCTDPRLITSLSWEDWPWEHRPRGMAGESLANVQACESHRALQKESCFDLRIHTCSGNPGLYAVNEV
jgi:hypothetical protein